MSPSAQYVTVYGRNVAVAAARLAAAGVNAYDFVNTDDGFRFWVRKKDSKKTFAILDELCYNYSAAKRTYAARLLLGVSKRLGLILGIVAFSVLLGIARGYVWKIDVTGNEDVPTKIILNELKREGCRVGRKAGNFDGAALSSAVQKIDGVKFASVYKVGTTVKVEIYESEKVTPPIAYYDTDITSRYDATVTKIVLREGTAAVAVGDNVFRGEPLIYAHRTDAVGEQVKCKASGAVYGKVAFTKSVTVATEWYEDVAVKTYSSTYLKIFGLRIGGKAVEPNSEVISVSNKLNAFLPIEVVSRKITVTERIKRSATVEELSERARTAAESEFIHGQIASGISSSCTVRDLGGGLWQINIFIQAEAVIGGL